jgi:hypothetical protein
MKKAALAIVLLAAALWYLRDPAWLRDTSSGLRPWQQDASGVRYRWSSGHASFFVASDAPAVGIPVSSTFEKGQDAPILVTVTVDDMPAWRVVLTDTEWRTMIVRLPPPGSRRFRRIDVRTGVVRDDNHGVKLGEVQVISPR